MEMKRVEGLVWRELGIGSCCGNQLILKTFSLVLFLLGWRMEGGEVLKVDGAKRNPYAYLFPHHMLLIWIRRFGWRMG